MGIVKGTTQDKLHLVKTYDPSQPYIVGVNGVTAVYIDTDGINHVVYMINGIKYHTTLIKEWNDTINSRSGVSAININNPISSSKSYVPPIGGGGLAGLDADRINPTTFEYTTQPYTDITSYFVFKDEAKMGVVFTPKVEAEVFIERQSMSVYESQTRLGEITSLEMLEEYNNGFYNITKTE